MHTVVWVRFTPHLLLYTQFCCLVLRIYICMLVDDILYPSWDGVALFLVTVIWKQRACIGLAHAGGDEVYTVGRVIVGQQPFGHVGPLRVYELVYGVNRRRQIRSEDRNILAKY